MSSEDKIAKTLKKIGQEKYGGPGAPAKWTPPPKPKPKPKPKSPLTQSHKTYPATPPPQRLPHSGLRIVQPFDTLHADMFNDLAIAIEKLCAEVDSLRAELNAINHTPCAECGERALPDDYLCKRHRECST